MTIDHPAIDTDVHRVRPGEAVDLSTVPTRESAGFDGDKADGKELARQQVVRLGELQELLHASKGAKLLVVLQGMDTAGKDSTTRRVFSEVSPYGVRVWSFGRPSELELAHEYLWRVSARTPAAGEIAIFNRSHYEDVLVVRVHGLVPEDRWRRRYRHLVDFEQRLVDEGTVVRKFFLHLSHDEQRERLQDRVDDPTKHWKFAAGDLAERARWHDYRAAYEEMLARTSTDAAPWYVVPADRKWLRDLVVASVLVEALEGLDLRYPPPTEEMPAEPIT